MRLYLDQMFGEDLADWLRSAGHDVLRATEAGQRRADDAEVLRAAISQGRTLVTLDEHFGDWVVLPLTEHAGVIRLKIDPTTSANAMALLGPLLLGNRQEDFLNHLVIVSRRSARWIRTG